MLGLGIGSFLLGLIHLYNKGRHIYMKQQRSNTFSKGLMLLFFFSITVMTLSAQEWHVKVGDSLPSFVVTNKAGMQIKSQDLKGSVVLLNFFATWCPPCRQELPRLQKEIWDRWGNREDFEVLVLAREEGWDKLDPFIKNNEYTFPFYPDLKREVFSLFADSSIPRNVLIDKEGKIAYLSIGYSEKEFTAFVGLIEKALAQ